MSNTKWWKAFSKVRDIITTDTSKKSFALHYQKVHFHSKHAESFKHFITKAAISKLLFNENRSFVSEFNITDKRKVDIWDVDENVVYEVESLGFSDKDDLGLFTTVVDLHDMPEEAKVGLVYLEKWLKEIVLGENKND